MSKGEKKIPFGDNVPRGWIIINTIEIHGKIYHVIRPKKPEK